jgi:hypothetical protein
VWNRLLTIWTRSHSRGLCRCSSRGGALPSDTCGPPLRLVTNRLVKAPALVCLRYGVVTIDDPRTCPGLAQKRHEPFELAADAGKRGTGPSEGTGDVNWSTRCVPARTDAATRHSPSTAPSEQRHLSPPVLLAVRPNSSATPVEADRSA